MKRTFSKAREDFYMISHYLNIVLNKMCNRSQVNRIRIDMNNKIEDLIKDL